MTDLSVVIPAYNESGNIGALVTEINQALSGVVSYEILIIDDGSNDGSAEEALNAGRHVRVLRHKNRTGKSRALVSGFQAARGQWIATLDGDGQNNPLDLARLWPRIAQSQPALFAGVSKRRNDGVVKLLTSKSANFIRKRLRRDNRTDAGRTLNPHPASLQLSLRRRLRMKLADFDVSNFTPPSLRRLLTPANSAGWDCAIRGQRRARSSGLFCPSPSSVAIHCPLAA
jgi:dolichol-phosphate mannosyltransferase